MIDRERRIQDRAHEIWEKQGYPEGCAEAHWIEAERLLDIEDQPEISGPPISVDPQVDVSENLVQGQRDERSSVVQGPCGAGSRVLEHPISGRAVDTEILTHIAFKGDLVFVNLASDENFWFEGISLDCADAVLEYRVCWPDGYWSDWHSSGHFAGTRGQSKSITGMTIRITEMCSKQFNLSSSCRFLGSEDWVEVANGKDNCSSSGQALCGIKINLTKGPSDNVHP
jgi:hypothetical protein